MKVHMHNQHARFHACRPQTIWRVDELSELPEPGRRWIELEVTSSSAEAPPLVRGGVDDPAGQPLAPVLERLALQGTGLCLRLLSGGPLLPRLKRTLERMPWDPTRLRFHARLRAEELETLAHWFPEAGLQCPVDFLVPLLLDGVEPVRDVFESLAARGVDRFALGWFTPQLDEVVRKLTAWGFQLHLDHVPEQDRHRAEALGVRSIGMRSGSKLPPLMAG